MRRAKISLPTFLALGLAACPAVEVQEAAPPGYEIWAMDQGTHRIHIYDGSLEPLEVVDLEPSGVRVPHMIHFTSDGAYAFVAGVGSGNTAVIRAGDRAVVEVIETGPRTHMATVAPDDRIALVSVIGSPDEPWDGELVELELDVAGEAWEIGRRLTISEDPLFRERRGEFRDSGPVCSFFTGDGRYAYVTLGPDLDDGGVVVLDRETFSLAAVHPPGEVPANCGTMLTPDGSRMIVNAGSAEVGRWFAFDTRSHELVHEADSRGIDAHGVWATPDGREVWMVNRVSDDAIVIDPESLDVVAEIDDVGITPDIIAMSPDSRYAFITLRGPNPVTMPHVAEGETPGFSVVDVATRELVRIVEPDEGNPDSDFHGIAVRVIR
jgi:YVTN family beta-propeller protein